MFYHINGVVTDIEPNLAVLECGGVGYALNVSLNTLASVKIGERAKLYIYECIREDAHDLYGFGSKSEKHCFELLLGISGVGPKAALSILSSNTPDGLALAVLNSDEKALTSAPGIGKRIAQRILNSRTKWPRRARALIFPTSRRPCLHPMRLRPRAVMRSPV